MISKFTKRVFFSLVEILYNYWKLLIFIICVPIFIGGVQFYNELTRSPNDAVTTFSIDNITVTLVYPDKINTGGKANMQLTAEVSKTTTISQNITITLDANDPFATIGDLSFSTILSPTHYVEQWSDISLKYGQPRLSSSTLPIKVEATVNQQSNEKKVEIRLDGFSEKLISLVGLTIAAVIGTLSFIGQIRKVIGR